MSFGFQWWRFIDCRGSIIRERIVDCFPTKMKSHQDAREHVWVFSQACRNLPFFNKFCFRVQVVFLRRDFVGGFLCMEYVVVWKSTAYLCLRRFSSLTHMKLLCLCNHIFSHCRNTLTNISFAASSYYLLIQWHEKKAQRLIKAIKVTKEKQKMKK